MTYTYANAENTSITDGQGKFIPVDDSNKDYQKLIADNVTIEPYVAPACSSRIHIKINNH